MIPTAWRGEEEVERGKREVERGRGEVEWEGGKGEKEKEEKHVTCPLNSLVPRPSLSTSIVLQVESEALGTRLTF